MSESSRRRPAARARFPARPEPAPPEPAPDLPLRRFVAEICLPRVAEKPAQARNLRAALSRFETFLAATGTATTAAGAPRSDRRPATIAALTSENLFAFCEWLLDQKKSATTADRYRAALQFVGRLARGAGLLAAAPHCPKLRTHWSRPGAEPFTSRELERLFGSARTMPGEVAGVPAGRWWLALLVTSFDCELAGPTLLQLPATAFDRPRKTLAAAGLRYRLHPKTVALLTRLIDAAAAADTAGEQKLFPWDRDNGRPPFYALYSRGRELLARARLPRQTRLFERLRASAAASTDSLDPIDLAAPFRPREIPLPQPRRRGDSPGPRPRANPKLAAPIGFGPLRPDRPRRAAAPPLVLIQPLPGTRTLRAFFEQFYVPRYMGGFPPQTIASYRSTVDLISHYAGAEIPIETLDDDLVERFLGWLAAGGARPATRKRRRAEILAIWRKAYRKKWTETEPRDIDPIRVPRTIPQAWSIDEIDRLLRTAAAIDGFVGTIPARFFWPALISLLFDTGLRIGAAMSLRVADVDWESGWIKARWETQKQRADQVLPISAETRLLLLATDPLRRALLFPWPLGAKDIRRGLIYRLRKLLQLAGLPAGPKDLFHKLRRTNATYVADAAGEEQARRQLGHSDLSVTRRYVDPTKLSAGRIVDSMRRPSFVHPDLAPPIPPQRRLTDDREVVP